jgi:hypothetical protein
MALLSFIEEKRMLSKDQILGARDFETKEIDVPEWGGTVTIRELSSKDRDNFEAELHMTDDLRNLRARLVVKAIIDENGERMFADSDAEALGNKSSSVLIRIFDAVRDMNGMDDEALEEAQGN